MKNEDSTSNSTVERNLAALDKTPLARSGGWNPRRLSSCVHGFITPTLAASRLIPPAVRQRTEQRIRSYAEARDAGSFTRLEIRFRGQLCYIDAYTEPGEPSPAQLHPLGETREQFMERLRNAPIHLCRLRYFGNEEKWSMAFYTYSQEKYEPCTFPDGSFQGPPEAAFEIAAVNLRAE